MGMAGQVGAEPLAGGRGEAEPSVAVRGGVRKEGFKGRAAVLGESGLQRQHSAAAGRGESRAIIQRHCACLKGKGREILGISDG